MARRSALSQLNRSVKMIAREVERSGRESEKRRLQAVREADLARKASEKAWAQAEKAVDAERKRLEKEARLAHIAEQEAEVEALNFGLTEELEDLEGLLAATLDVDDFVDLESLRATVDHPPFPRPDLEKPLPPPLPVEDPLEPTPGQLEPSKIATYLLGKKWRKKAIGKREESFARKNEQWSRQMVEVSSQRLKLVEEREAGEKRRLAQLDEQRKIYEHECASREAEAAERNQELDQLIANLGYGVKEAVEEYISIVLSNSIYPEHFPIAHEFEFDGVHAELKLFVELPHPDTLNPRKAYRYLKSKDEITETMLSQKVLKDRYSSAVHQVALRTLHEVFEADRREIIQTISLEAGIRAPDPSTGQAGFLTFVALGTARQTFMEIELANVVPQATLAHLGAVLSKNPHGLQPVSAAGVRKAK